MTGDGNSAPNGTYKSKKTSEYWDNIEARQDAFYKEWKAARRAEEIITDPKKIRLIRINGGCIVVIAVLTIVYGVIYLAKTPARLDSIPKSISPYEPFPNLYDYYPDASPAVVLIVFYVVMWFISGIYNLKHGQWVSRRIFNRFFLSLALAIPLMIVAQGEMEKPYSDSLLIQQKTWAKERYGITYNTIWIDSYSKGRSTYHYQSDVISRGKTIATVCFKEDMTLFCEPGSTKEFPVLIKK